MDVDMKGKLSLDGVGRGLNLLSNHMHKFQLT